MNYQADVPRQILQEAKFHYDKNVKIAEKVFGLTVEGYEFLLNDVAKARGHAWNYPFQFSRKTEQSLWYIIPDYGREAYPCSLIIKNFYYIGISIETTVIKNVIKWKCSIGADNKNTILDISLEKAVCEAALNFVGVTLNHICCVCNKDSTWVRKAPFYEDYFCEEHKLESHFGQKDDSYFSWEKI